MENWNGLVYIKYILYKKQNNKNFSTEKIPNYPTPNREIVPILHKLFQETTLCDSFYEVDPDTTS